MVKMKSAIQIFPFNCAEPNELTILIGELELRNLTVGSDRPAAQLPHLSLPKQKQKSSYDQRNREHRHLPCDRRFGERWVRGGGSCTHDFVRTSVNRSNAR